MRVWVEVTVSDGTTLRDIPTDIAKVAHRIVTESGTVLKDRRGQVTSPTQRG